MADAGGGARLGRPWRRAGRHTSVAERTLASRWELVRRRREAGSNDLAPPRPLTAEIRRQPGPMRCRTAQGTTTGHPCRCSCPTAPSHTSQLERMVSVWRMRIPPSIC